MHKAKRYLIHDYGVDDPLDKLPRTKQQQYLIRYLSELGAISVLEEQNYFDRDYLAEFSAFYSISSQGYPNICRRIHFFSIKISRALVRKAANGNSNATGKLQDSYLGFIVVRPIPAAPFGRTVLKWFVDHQLATPRVISPSRNYDVHIAGITLTINGLAWQQQDSAVGACATVGLWSMLHSSAFDDHHAIPTTADITMAANKKASLGARVFPSGGLNIYQICEAIKEQDLSPVSLEGDVKGSNNLGVVGFSRDRFSSSCAAFIRSGYPVLIIGDLGSGYHAVCCVGFRSNACKANENIELQDSTIEFLYIHDDNLGPNVRFQIGEEIVRKENKKEIKRVVLYPKAPKKDSVDDSSEESVDNYKKFYPSQLLVAVHNDLRTSPDKLHTAGLIHADILQRLLTHIAGKASVQPDHLTVSTRFIKLSQYLGRELEDTLGKEDKITGKARLDLCEKVVPMSLHIGLVRIGRSDSTPLMDILYDTTDSDLNHPVFATIVYNPIIELLIESIIKLLDSGQTLNLAQLEFGTLVIAHEFV